MRQPVRLRAVTRSNAALAPAPGTRWWHSEETFRELVENAHDLIYSIDLEGRFSHVNRAALRVCGYTRDEILEMNIAHLVAPEYLAKARQMIQCALRGEAPELYDLDLVTKDGRRVTVEITHRLVLEDGIPVGTHAIARDITERRRAERLEQDRMRVLEMIAARRPLAEVLDHLVRMLERQNPDWRGAILLQRDNRLYVASAPSLPPEFVNRLDGIRVGVASGTCAAASYWRRPVVTEDIAADPAWAELGNAALQAGLRACWSAPIITGTGRLVGTLAVYQDQPGAPAPSEAKLLEMTCGSAALAIDHRQMTDELAYQAHHDSLTGLPNRVLFEERLHQAIHAARRAQLQVALLYIDVDEFKLINDTLGHPVGDLLLRQVAWRLAGCIRETDTLARMSGDEFVIVAGGLQDAEGARRIAEAVLELLREPFPLDGHELFVTASVGISVFPRDGQDAGALLRAADAAIYRAKRQGKNRYHYHTPEMRDALKERFSVETHLRRALDRQEFTLHYQPQFDLRSGRLCGYEALMRWTHPKLGAVSPARFIPVAEESGLIREMGAWALGEACQQARRWQAAGRPPSRMAVNVSAIQLSAPGFLETVRQALEQTRLEPASLELEITESVLLRDVDEFVRKLRDLRQLGVRISVDDFGTGYSSLSYLQSLPLDTVKLDRSFVQALKNSRSGLPLVQAVVAMAHGLGLWVTAEGVETHQQLEAIHQTGCDFAQGYLLGMPKPPQHAPEHDTFAALRLPEKRPPRRD